MNIHLELTRQFNAGRFRAVICSEQAVVLHRLAIMSKDGDWVLRENPETMDHVLGVLAERGARYRFGAPLDVRWMTGGWSSHLQLSHEKLRIRTDFFTRPPRISTPRLALLWREQEGRDPPFVGVEDLAEIKKTNREKDYAVIGELARMMADVRDQLLYSRSARDLIGLAEEHPDTLSEVVERRPDVLGMISFGRAELEAALDAERRRLIHANEERLGAYMEAAKNWSQMWPEVARLINGRPLTEAHSILVERAEGVLPFHLEH
ncbi:hypothetical protein ES707_05861 [subsurface metagenome]